jgi:plastocyanin
MDTARPLCAARRSCRAHDRSLALLVLLLCVGTICLHSTDDVATPRPFQGSADEKGKAASAGAIEGVVTFRGEVPKSAVADDTGVRRDLLHVDRESGGLRYAVAWLAIDKGLAHEPESQAASPRGDGTLPVLMDQRDHEFVPRLLAVRSGQPVKFTNSDSANHNVHTSSPQRTNEFNVFTRVDSSYTHRFAPDPQQRPVRLGCDIHPWMCGWIYVFDHPFFAVTDTQGRFRIAAVPAGRYKLMIQQPDAGYSVEREISVARGETASVEVQIKREDLKIK